MPRIYTEFTAPPHLAGRAHPHPAVKHCLDNSNSPFVLVAEPSEADVFVLPYEWSYYVFEGRTGEAKALAAKARQYGKKVWAWHRGDLPPRIPLENCFSCQSALYRSRWTERQIPSPFFIDDPLPSHCGSELKLRQKRERPTVGFCGYGDAVWAKIAYGSYLNLRHNFRSRRADASWETMPWRPATLLRASALKRLDRDARIDTVFRVRRKAFKILSQAAAAPETKPLVTEYFDTILSTDYTLCIRGYGNWSVRLWETLACGRIPIFVDTDCVLPDAGIDWREFAVWVDASELASLPEHLLDFHARLSPREFLEKQRLCRRIWVERFSRDGFMKYLADERLPQLLAPLAPDFDEIAR
ncbi:MAG: exostosin family protein [Bryobacteraceae bacterium]